jgi:hypothetical protein
MDPDPAIFVIDLHDANKKLFFYFIFSAYYFLKLHFLHLFAKIKSQKESQNSRNQGFSYYFCMMIEGSRRLETCGSGGSGSATLPVCLRHLKDLTVLALRTLLFYVALTCC